MKIKSFFVVKIHVTLTEKCLKKPENSPYNIFQKEEMNLYLALVKYFDIKAVYVRRYSKICFAPAAVWVGKARTIWQYCGLTYNIMAAISGCSNSVHLFIHHFNIFLHSFMQVYLFSNVIFVYNMIQ